MKLVILSHEGNRVWFDAYDDNGNALYSTERDCTKEVEAAKRQHKPFEDVLLASEKAHPSLRIRL